MWLLVFMPVLSGCEGCRRLDTSAEAEKKNDPKAAPVNAFTVGKAVPLPSSGTAEGTAIKPGHWFTLRLPIRSNQADQRGDLSVETFVNNGNTDSESREAVGESLFCQRPAVLPKGRMKRLDARLLAERNDLSLGRRFSTAVKFTSPTAFANSETRDHGVMHGNEYFFAILTKRPERFASFQIADWVRPPLSEEAGAVVPANYRIVFPRTEGLLGLPDTALDWTSTAIVFWDDVSPSEMTPEQRRALTDWLYFGGRMIVNGDGIAGELANSELGPLLPLTVKGMNVFDSETMTQLIDHWSIESDESRVAISELVRSQTSRIAIAGEITPDSKAIEGTAELLASRAVGRGEIVMSRFDLTSDWMIGWRSRDSFFNAAVLGRPGRDYETNAGLLSQRYLPSKPGSPSPERGAAINTSLRFLARDARLQSIGKAPQKSSRPVPDQLVGAAVELANEAAPGTDRADQADGAPKVLDEAPVEFSQHPISGLCSWRDDGDAALLMIAVLRDQSGVKIPPVPFVARTLLIYLLILLPLNYIVFRLLGKLEWAWLAVPFLAISGAGWVAKTVSLDLGLARNQSEVSLVEIQPGYERGHVTRFTSIYNSLSGNYQIKFDSPDAAAAPVNRLSNDRNEFSPCAFRYGYEDGPVLENFAVPSNRTRVFHAEQFVDLGGVFELSNDSLINNTRVPLIDATIVRRSMDGTMEHSLIGEMEPGSRSRLRWVTKPLSKEFDPIMQPFAEGDSIPRGGVRLIARTQQPLAGMEISPSTPQQSSTNIVIAHLMHPVRSRSSGDANLIPSKKEREKLLQDQGIDPSMVKEIIVP